MIIPSASPDAVVSLGSDFLLFLGATVLVVPVFKSARQSPVLGYLFAGLVMGQLGLFRDVEEIEKLSELGVLFLLFEMGLELSLDKLRSLAKYAFGLGSLQMALTSAAFMAVSLPPGEGLMTKILKVVTNAPPSLAEIKTADEAIVIAVALSLSSSAFVLQLLKERGELETKFGQATLGILLFQDIATVPFLVLLPLIEGRGIDGGLDGLDGAALLTQLGPTALKTLGGLSLVLLGGRTLVRRLFEVVASARSSEVFIALCLLTVTGASLLTQRLGFSDTLGAFVAGVLLSETNFKTQVEADIQPFRGLLLGLFFVTTGASLDLALLIRQWPTVLGLLVGLLALKATVITAIGPIVGLSKSESIRTGFILSQGGEFAFVLLALASQLKVLPTDLNKLLIIVVVLSMATTPLLTEAGKVVGEIVAGATDGAALASRGTEGFNLEDPVIICGFGDVGQAVANMLQVLEIPYVAFDLTVARVQAAQEAGFNVLYGDATRLKVLEAAGIHSPRAVAVAYTARQRAVAAVASLRGAFPNVPIMVRSIDLTHAWELEEAGATQVVLSEAEAGLAVGSRLIVELGSESSLVSALAQAMREDMEARTHELAAVAPSGSEGSAAGKEGNGAATLRSVYKFESRREVWDSTSSGGVALADDAGGGGLLANIGATILTAMGSGDVSEDEAGLDSRYRNGRTSQGSATSFVESSSVNSSGRTGIPEVYDEVGGIEDTTSVTLERSGGEVVLPDGSLECPVDWEGGRPVNDEARSEDRR